MARHKKRKFAELATFDNFFDQPENINGDWRELFFKNSNPLILELGCGKGEYTNELGKRFPDINFIGIDLKGVRLWRAAKNAIDAELTNVAFLKINIDHIAYFFKNDEVDEIWIPFPDPYPKPSKWKKRLVSSKFLSMYRQILKPNGIVHFKTDNTGLYEFAIETFSNQKLNIIENTIDLYNSEILNSYNSIPTYFEQLFKEKGETIKYIKFKFS
jgi:tRNA (guanine-N7-)-methyltransferase